MCCLLTKTHHSIRGNGDKISDDMVLDLCHIIRFLGDRLGGVWLVPIVDVDDVHNSYFK